MSVVKEPVSGSNPFYGCAILIIAACTFGGIIGYTLYSGYKQNKEIDSFTEHDAPALPVAALTDAHRTELEGKLDAFTKVAKNKKPVKLPLSVEELNQLITLAGEKEVADYRGIMRFTGLDAKTGRILADIRWKMNNLPFVKAPDRFLVGSAVFVPKVGNGTFDLYIETVTVPGKTVSPGFIGQLQNIPWLNLAKIKPEIADVMKLVNKFEFTGDGTSFVLEANAVTATPADANGDAEKK
jgi:hypothetical protein